MHKLAIDLAILAAGGFVTSTFEYFFKYNLVDLIKDKILGLFKKAQSDVKSAEITLKADLKRKL